MENDNHIDDLFRSSLETEKIEPSAGIWNAIQKRLAQSGPAGSKRSHRKGWWFFTIAVLLTAFSVYHFAFRKNNAAPEKISPAEITSANENISENSVTEHSGNSIRHNNNVSVGKTTPENTTNDFLRNERRSQKVVTTNNDQIISPDNKNTNMVNNSITLKYKSARKSISNNTNEAHYSDEKKSQEKNFKNKNNIQSFDTESRTGNTQSLKTNSTDRINNFSEENNNNNNNNNNSSENLSAFTTENINENSERNLSSSPVAAENKSDNNSIIKSAEITPADNTNVNLPPVPDGEVIPYSPENVNPKPSQLPAGIIPGDTTKIIAQSVDTSNAADYAAPAKQDSSKSFLGKAISHLSIEGYFSPDYVSKRISENVNYSGPESDQVNSYSKEKSAFSFNTGIRLKYDLSDKFSITAGASYSEYSFNGEFSEITVIQDSVYREDHGHGHQDNHGHGHGGNNQGGNGHSQGGNPPGGNNEPPHYVVQTSCGAVDLHNTPPNSGSQHGNVIDVNALTEQTISFINIPVTLRYQINRSRFNWYGYLGAALNLTQADHVKIIIDGSFSETNDLDGLRSMNYTGLAGIGAEYRLNNYLGIFLEPNIRYSLSPINENNPVNSYPYFIGIGAGLSYHFH